MKLRNIGIIAHVDAGKTTTTERILHTVGYINHVGSVDAGTTIADFLPQERKRGITIQSCSIPILYKEHKINLIDTPGHVDFQFQVEKSLRVLDGCVVILDGVSGVEAQTVKVWKQANIYKKSRIVFVNKMDRAEASFYESVKSMEKLKGWGTPLICQLPIYTSRVGINSVRNKRGDGIFRGVVDLVYFKQITVNGDGGLETSTIPDEMVKDVTKAREMLVEKLADLDNEMLDLAITEEDYSKIDGRDISHSLRKVTLAGTAVPVLLGSGFKNIGVPQLLDSIIDYLPSPVDVGSCDSSKELSALVFKVTKDLTRGLLTFVRVYDGIIQPKVALKIGNTIEKAVKVYEIFANDYKQIDSIQSGNIGVIQGLKNAKTGDTIRTGDTQILEPIFIPQPVFFRQLEPDSMKDEKLLKECLLELERDDPSLHVSFEEDEIFLAGLGELHLEIAKDRLENMNCKFSMGPISISYRERIHGNTTEFVKFSRVLGDKTVECGLELNITVEDDVDTEILINVSEREVYQDEKFQNNHNFNDHLNVADICDAIADGIRSSLTRGPHGYPITKIKIECRKVVMYNNQTTLSTVRAAAYDITSLLIKETGTTVLEPIMNLKIIVPSNYSAVVIRDFNGKRRGNILNVESVGDSTSIEGRAALETLVGYSSEIRGICRGSGEWSMELCDYEEVTSNQRAQNL